jgi:hypothetical protein
MNSTIQMQTNEAQYATVKKWIALRMCKRMKKNLQTLTIEERYATAKNEVQ